MLGNMGDEKVKVIYYEKNKYKIHFDPKDLVPNKYIINPDNSKLIHWSNVLLVVLIIYIFLLPLYVSYSPILSNQNFKTLLMFDFCFLLDKIIHLFIGFTNDQGYFEPKIF